MLHFRFQAFWLLWALTVVITAASVSYTHGRFKGDDILSATPTHEEVFQSCSNFGTNTAMQIVAVQQAFKWYTFAVYVGTTVACIAFAIIQQRSYYDEEANNVTMEDFGLAVYHMPVEKARNNIEEDYTKYFKNLFGEKSVIGVSICWDYAQIEDDVIEQVTSHLHESDKEFDGEFLTDSYVPNVYKQVKHDRQGCNLPELRCLDNMIVGSSVDSESSEHVSPRACESKVKALIENLSTTGIVFVILNSEKEQQRALELVKTRAEEGNPIKYEGVEQPLMIRRETWDPATLLWTGFSVRKHQRNINILKGVLIVMTVIVVWAVCFYGPYVMYVLSWANVAGGSQGDANTMSMLSLMCAIGNQVVYFTCAKVADMVGFRSKDFAMTFNCCLYTIAVFINIVVDVSLMLVMAHGYQQDSGMDPHATIRNPSFQYSLYLQLVTYLYPMTLLAPYMAEPLPMNIIPYFLSKWMVRSAFSISRYDAEQSLVCPEFDLLRYGDIIINVSTVIICFFLASSSLWWIFTWLLVSNLVIYMWDHFRFLRCCQETFFANDLMECCSQLISALPCALLAAAYVFKRYEGEELLKSFDVAIVRSDPRDILKPMRAEDFRVDLKDISSDLWYTVIAAFWAHLVIHIFVVKCLVPKLLPADEEVSEVSYATFQKHHACNWFNSNPVHCLRSAFLHNHSPPYLYFVRGKEYTHKRNDEIHQYYEEHQVKDADVGVAEELQGALHKQKSKVLSFGAAATNSFKNRFRTNPKGKLKSADRSQDHASDDVEGGCQIL
jgi:hypothetical protein